MNLFFVTFERIVLPSYNLLIKKFTPPLNYLLSALSVFSAEQTTNNFDCVCVHDMETKKEGLLTSIILYLYRYIISSSIVAVSCTGSGKKIQLRASICSGAIIMFQGYLNWLTRDNNIDTINTIQSRSNKVVNIKL